MDSMKVKISQFTLRVLLPLSTIRFSCLRRVQKGGNNGRMELRKRCQLMLSCNPIGTHNIPTTQKASTQ